MDTAMMDLRRFRRKNNIRQDVLAERLGVSKSYLSQIEAGKMKLSGNLLYKLHEVCEKLDLDFNAIYIDPSEEAPDTEFDNNYNYVWLLPTGARAGTIADFASAVKKFDCERVLSPIRGADYAMTVTGDSMAPEYESGCQVIIKRIDEEQFVEWGKTYVLDTCNGAVIKKVYPTDDRGVVECRSVNPAYPPFKIQTENIRGWYRVLLAMSLK